MKENKQTKVLEGTQERTQEDALEKMPKDAQAKGQIGAQEDAHKTAQGWWRWVLQLLRTMLELLRLRRPQRPQPSRAATSGMAATATTTPSATTTPPQATQTPRSQRTKRPQQQEALALLRERYALRYNVMTEETEFRRRDAEDAVWQTVDVRTFNTMTIDTIDAGLGMWGRDVDRLLHSHSVETYHPLQSYVAELPAWDGVDRVRDLARRVSDDPLWEVGFAVWLRAMVALWMGHPRCRSNQLVPLLVSAEQGWHKSSFCRNLLPEALSRYYTDQFVPTKDGEQMLARLALINLDEYDRYTLRQVPRLKNLIQLEHLSVRRAYHQEWMSLPRCASFIGTSNEQELLSDTTGSRRYLCVAVKHDIDSEGIAHEQLFAQLKAEVESGLPLFLNEAEERALEEHNRAFCQRSPMLEILWHCFRRPEEGEDAELLTATQIFVMMQQRFPAALRTQRPTVLGRLLRAEGLRSWHTMHGNCYRLVPLEE